MIAEGARTPLAELAEAAAGIAALDDLGEAIDLLAGAVGTVLRADAVVVRLRDPDGLLVARAVAPVGSALAAELAGTTVHPDRLDEEGAPESTSRAAERVRASGVLAAPARAQGQIVGSVEAVRISAPFDESEQALAELAAAQLALAVRLLRPDALARAIPRGRALGLAGDALAAGGDLRQAAQQAVLIGVEASGATAGALWRGAPVAPELAAAVGLPDDALHTAAELAARALDGRASALRSDPRLPAGLRSVAAFPLGQPPLGALQLFFGRGHVPSPDELATLASFAARSAHALRQGAHLDELSDELERMRAVLQVTGAASSELSLSHTLETALDRIGALLGVERLGLYLSDDEQLQAAAARSLPAGHLDVADALLAAAVGPLRARSVVRADVAGAEPALTAVRNALVTGGEPSAVGVPLLIRGEPIGLLVAWPGERGIAESDASLLDAIAAQLAVSVQNARLHERSQLLSEERSRALSSARDAGRSLVALYEISNAFAETLSLERTARLDRVDGRRRPRCRRGAAASAGRARRGARAPLAARGRRASPRRRRAAARPAPAGSVATHLPTGEAHRRIGEAPGRVVRAARAVPRTGLDGGADPDRREGRAARRADDPVARPRRADRRRDARHGAGRSPPRPRSRSTTRGSTSSQELRRDDAAVAAPAGRAERGRARGRLPLRVGRAGRGRRRRVRLPRPARRPARRRARRRHGARHRRGGRHGDGEVRVPVARARALRSPLRSSRTRTTWSRPRSRSAEFITMVYVTVDAAGTFACASAGHPRPRLVRPDGRVDELRCGGLALGIAPDQQYEEERVELQRGAAVVLYTDGVVEARRDGERTTGSNGSTPCSPLHAASSAQATADAVLADCRAFAGGELSDDCAVVVIRRP